MVLRITVRPQPDFVPGPIAPPQEGAPAPAPAAEPSGGAPDFNPWSAVADERTLESGMVLQTQAREVAQARDWLDQVAPDEPPAEPVLPATAKEPTAFGSVVADVARGATEAPRQTLGGARDAAQAAINGIGAVGDWLNKHVADLGTVEIPVDPEKTSIAGLPLVGMPRLRKSDTAAAMPQLPEVKAATTTTGGAVRSVAQFLAGFVGAGKLLGAAAPSGFAGAALKGGMADLAAFDAHEQRLADLVQQAPALQNPVTEFLAHKGDEGEIEGRFKRAVEGLGLGVAAEGLVLALRAVKAARAARAGDASGRSAAVEAARRDAQPLTLLGDENADLIASLPTLQQSRGGTRGAALPKEPDLGVPADVAARALTPEGMTPLFGEGRDTVFVNFARIRSGEDVKRAIADMVEAFKGDIETARRGVRSNKTTLMASGKEDAWQLIVQRKRGEPFNAEEAVAVRRLWEASGQKLVDVAEIAKNSPTPENLFQFRWMLSTHKLIQEQVIAARTETARALQSWSIPAGGLGGQERMRHIENVLASFGGEEANEMLARKVAGLKNLEDGMQVLTDVAEKGAFAKTLDVAKELWINALLSNPKTHVVNMLGNSIAMGQELVERRAAAWWSRVLGSGEISAGEAAAKFFGQVHATREALRLAARALKTGESQFGAATTKTADVGFERAISSTHLGIDPNSYLGITADRLGTVVNTATRFLTAEDDFFKALGYRGEVAAQAFRQASREVTDGVIARDGFKARVAELMADPPESIRLASVDAALYSTFTTKPGNFVTQMNALDRKWMASEHPGAQLWSFGMRVLIPFRNTPSNLMTYAFERTPLAPLMGRYRDAIKEGGAAADMARTRMALGTTTLLAIMDLALDSHITGGGPREQKDRGTRDTLQRAGWQPYSIKVGDRYFSYKRTDPLGITLGIAADVAELVNNASLDEDKRDEIFELTAAAVASFGNLILDKTYMQTVSDTIDVLHNQGKAPSFLEKRIAAFEPAILGETRRQVDPYMRYTQDLVTEIKNRTPGFSSDLPIARDVWGRPRTFQSGLGAVYDALSPIASKRYDPTPIDAEAIKHDFNLAPPTPSLSFGRGIAVSLRNRTEAYSRFLELRGQSKPTDLGADADYRGSPAKAPVPDAQLVFAKYGNQPLFDLVNAIVSGKHRLSADYEKAGGGRNGGKDAMITRIVSDYGRAAKWKTVDEFPELAAVVGRKQETIRSRK